MMIAHSKKFLLVHHPVNLAEARYFTESLTRVGYSFELYSIPEDASLTTLNERLKSAKLPVLLFISDNYLKTAACVYNGLGIAQELSAANKLLPIVVQGRGPDPETGEMTDIPTRFERVGDVIHYLNYWQDHYLDLRKQKRHPEPGSDEEALNQEINITRSISAEIGEYLRHLRVIPHLFFDNLRETFFEGFFRLANDKDGFLAFKAAQPIQEEPVTAAMPTEDVPTEEPPAEPEAIEIDLTPSIQPESRLIEKVVRTHQASEAEEEEDEEDEDDDEQVKAVEDLFDESEEEEEEKVKDSLENAQQAFEAGRLSAGLNTLYAAAEAHPDNRKVRFEYAKALVDYAQNRREAEQELEAVLQIDPHYGHALVLMGRLAEERQDFSRARNFYELAAEHGKGAEPSYRLGSLLLQYFEGEEELAAKCFKKAAKKDHDHVDAHYQYGVMAYESLGKPDKAVKYLKRTLKLQPDHPFAHYDLALIYYQLADREKAYEHYLHATEINPELRTPENDQAFYYEPAPQEEPIPEPQAAEVAPTPGPVPEIPEPQRVKLGKVLITGATSGIGRACAEAFARAGYDLILTGRREDRLEKIQQELKEAYGARIKTLSFDVRKVQSVEEAVFSLEGEWAEIDILINNAGLAKGLSPIHKGDLAHWETMIDTNIKGLLYMTRAVSPGMVSRQKGHIINVGSIAGKEVYPMGNVYCATKYAVDALTRAIRLDLHTFGIRVSQVAPGHVEETEFALVRYDGDEEKAKIYQDFQPLKASDVAETILYIASRPAHVNILDVVLTSTQQASALTIDRSGR